MMVEVGGLIEQLRALFTTDIDGMETEAEAVAVFDRACVKVLVATHNGQHKQPELTSGQKAAQTRARNRQARQAVTGSSVQKVNSVDREASDDKSAA